MTAAEFVQAFARQPFVMGQSDCASMVDGWIAHRTGRRPSEASGQVWADADSATALTRVCALPIRFGRAMRAVGLRGTKQPKEGDVAAIAVGPIVTCAVLVGRHWMFRNGEGLSGVAEPRVLMAWAVPRRSLIAAAVLPLIANSPLFFVDMPCPR